MPQQKNLKDITASAVQCVCVRIFDQEKQKEMFLVKEEVFIVHIVNATTGSGSDCAAILLQLER